MDGFGFGSGLAFLSLYLSSSITSHYPLEWNDRRNRSELSSAPAPEETAIANIFAKPKPKQLI